MTPSRTAADRSTPRSASDRCAEEDAWSRSVRERVGGEAYESWFAGLARLELTTSPKSATVRVATPYLLGYLRRTHGRDVTSAAADTFRSAGVEPVEVQWELDLSLAANSPDRSRPPAVERVPDRAAAAAGGGATFDDFVVGESNRTAWSIARSFVTDPVRGDNVVYLYGGTGTGKSHLLDACRAHIRQSAPSVRVLSLTAWEFGNLLGEAIQSRTTPSFRSRFRSVDVLLLDGVDFFDTQRREAFQDELLQTLERFESSGRAVLMTGGVHPKMMTKTSGELVSRYLSGHVARIAEPDAAVRKEFVGRHAAKIGLTMTPDAVDYVANKFRRSHRELRGALNTLCNEVRAEEDLRRLAEGESLLFDIVRKPTRTVGVTLARRLLGPLQQDATTIVRLSDIDREVCRFFGLETATLHAGGRQRAVSRPRMVAMYLARQLTPSAYQEIGNHYGGRNHSTVISAERTIRGLLKSGGQISAGQTDWAASDLVAELRQRLCG